MEDNTVVLYQKILEITKEIRTAIDQKDWEQVNSLAEKRGVFVQQTASYVKQKDKLSKDIKSKVNDLIKSITDLDKENIQIIEEAKSFLGKDRIKINIGQKALSAYKGMGRKIKQRYDEEL